MKTRKHIRLRNFDYSSQAWYYVTICTKNRKHSFGEIKNRQMYLSAIGEQANLYWNEIPKHFPHIELGEFIIMPNHIHGIIGIVQSPHDIVGYGPNDPNRNLLIQNKKKYDIVRTRHDVAQLEKSQNKESHDIVRTRRVVSQQREINEFGKTIAGSLSAIIGQFKSTLTRWSRKNGHENFAWHGRFHDHIIRSDGAFQRISDYIKDNPANWNKAKFRRR